MIDYICKPRIQRTWQYLPVDTHMHTHRCLQCSPNPIWHKMRRCTMQEKEDWSMFQSLFVRGGQDGWRELRKLSGRSEAVPGRTHFLEHESFQLSTVATHLHAWGQLQTQQPLVPRCPLGSKHTSNLLYHGSEYQWYCTIHDNKCSLCDWLYRIFPVSKV